MSARKRMEPRAQLVAEGRDAYLLVSLGAAAVAGAAVAGVAGAGVAVKSPLTPNGSTSTLPATLPESSSVAV